MKVAITGIGAVSAAGQGVSALLSKLQDPVCCFRPSTRHSVSFEILTGEAPGICFSEHEYPELDSPTGRLCLSAAKECISHAQTNGCKSPDALCLGTSTGGQSGNERAVFGLLENKPVGDFSYRKQGCMASPSRLLARSLNIFGSVRTVSTACTSSANAIALGASWINSGKCNRVLAGGGDALCYTTLSSFHILELTGPKACTPFGPDRPGLTLGDGAGFLMLEALDSVLLEGRIPLAVLTGFGMSSDAHHMTAPPEDGRGAASAMEKALSCAQITPLDVGYVNAHGTGTRLNDAAEACALSRVFGNTPVMSCKGLTGHTLGGAGALEAVISVLSLQEGNAFENFGAHIASDDCPVNLIGKGGQAFDPEKYVVSASFAFGGNNCVLVFGGVGGLK